MTATNIEMHTAVGVRVTFERMGALDPGNPDRPRTVSLSTLHDVIGALDEFCLIVNLASLLQEQVIDDSALLAFEEMYDFRASDPDHAQVIVELDSAVRDLAAPTARRVSMTSPLTIELIGSLTTGALFLLKNPGLIGGWLPTVREHWFHSQAEAERARRAYRALSDAGIKVEDLEN